MNALTEKQAHAVWDVLVEQAGAHEQERDSFVRYLMESQHSWGHEYRFIGLLGFGGKLHFNEYRGARISCYPHDRNPERDAIIDAVNKQLAELLHGI